MWEEWAAKLIREKFDAYDRLSTSHFLVTDYRPNGFHFFFFYFLHVIRIRKINLKAVNAIETSHSVLIRSKLVVAAAWLCINGWMPAEGISAYG